MIAIGVAAVAVLTAGLYSIGQVSARTDGTVERVVSVRYLPRSPRTTTTVPRTTTTTKVPTTTQAPPTTKATTTTTTKAPTTTTSKAPKPPVTTTTAPAPVPTTTAPPVTTPVAAPPAGLPTSTQQEMLALVNAKRVTGMTCGGTVFAAVPALTLSATLTKTSDAHALDMANRNYFSHTGANGSDPGTRMTAAGYRWSAWTENIAAGQPTPASVIAGWFDSAGHCANFMASVVTQVGFGKAENPSSTYGIYWVSDLGRPG